MQGKLTAQQKADDAKKHAELELLLLDEDENENEVARGFDMNDIEAHGGKKKKKKKGRHRKKMDADDEPDEHESAFKMDTQDPRFNKLVTDNQYHIDPTSGKLKNTSGMKELQQVNLCTVHA